ncbi:SDR family NAD(P)-dependent oxidoreductase [Conexibacter arvalis]|uniref:3-oxoacyl-[acyl-carrier protein] reductase n=1 Tax=Conexibacter arvalis TaxID=912552 RepID=A0A840IEB9_9ACTN|nr:SDR family oxidoreductase [Conexibacter arvalis]MBB4662414.1 3-oxoacyl-[acyl-carrier protein] reductase [Conexibacter arvalis]
MDGRVALVTGAARNIGAEIALRLAADGAAVAVNHRGADSAGAAGEVVRRIEAAGGAALAIEADVGDERAVERMAAAASDALGPVDLLVNNAAASVTAERPWLQLTADDWDRVLRTNVTACFLTAKALLPSLAAHRGSIVNISSIRAVTGKPGNLHYAASKAAQIGFTRALARELGPQGVRVNTLLVGAITTPDEARYGDQAEVDEQVLAVQALQRRGMPSDVAGVVSFLCQEAAGFITGQSLVVDGGWVLR